MTPGLIQVLEDRVINQIAAGEVVERPASVVKELVENALDAQAHHVRVTLKAGGRDLIQVEDDGAGMGRQDAMLCVERHATSKIRDAADLDGVRSLGFRGEALPSIAAVSRFELLTRARGEERGTRVVIDGGRMVDVSDAGCPEGTRVSVRSLFYNLPARRKFLRTVPTELSHCQGAVLRELLMRTAVGVELFHEGRPLIRATADEALGERVRTMLGRSAEGLVPVEVADQDLRLVGLVSPPGVHSGSARNALWLHVNGRAVRDPLLRRAVLDAFRGLVPKGRYPTAILDLRMNPRRVDVNVHPAKTEVRFTDGRQVSRVVAAGLRQALADQGIRPTALTPARTGRLQPTQQPEDQALLPGMARNPPPPTAPPTAGPHTGPTRSPGVDPPGTGTRPGRPAAFPSRGGALPPSPPPGVHLVADATARPLPPPPEPSAGRARALRLIGQHDGRWLICADGPRLLVVDQHQAHRAVLCRRLLAGEIAPRPLLTPALVELDEATAAALAADGLDELGVHLEDFGGGTVRVRALPEHLGGVDAGTVIGALADAADWDARALALAALGAVQPGQVLSTYEQKQLLAELGLSVRSGALVLDPDELERRSGR